MNSCMKKIVTAGVLATVGGNASVEASFTYKLAPVPGGYTQSAAGPTGGGSGNWAGEDLFPYFPGPLIPKEQSYLSGSSASTSATFNGPAGSGTATNSSNATAEMGSFNAVAFNNAPNNSSFAHAASTGGWSETFTISNPALTGQTGFMQFTLNVSGTLAATGFAGAASFDVTGTKTMGN